MSAQADLVQAFLQAQAVERAERGDDAPREMASSIGTPSWQLVDETQHDQTVQDGYPRHGDEPDRRRD